jgi:hypothetical protein
LAILERTKREAIQAAVGRWREQCLLGDGPLIFDDRTVWTQGNLTRLHDRVVKALLTDYRTFTEKFHGQLECGCDLVILGADALAD